jgi:superfamily II DNA/RNA helicase
MPKNFDEFVHRTGRTGRAGNLGRAISFIDEDIPEDGKLAAQIAMVGKNNWPKI